MNWQATPYEDKDIWSIAAFFKSQFKGLGRYGSADLFNWKIERNYRTNGLINLVKDGKKIASVTSITPKLCYLQNQPVEAAEIGDTFTDPSYQRQGMFALLINQSRKEAIERGHHLVYGTPNNQSLPGYQKKANFDVLKSISVSSMILPLRIKPYLPRIIPAPIRDFLSSLYWSFAYLRSYLVDTFSSAKYEIREVDRIPDDWEPFWQKMRSESALIFDRSADAINWRFYQSPNKYQMIELRKDQELLGYLIYSITSEPGVSNLILADYYVLNQDKRAFLALLRKAILAGLKYDVGYIMTWARNGSNYLKVLHRRGFFNKGPIPVIAYKNELFEKLDDLKGSHSIHFTISDSDNV